MCMRLLIGSSSGLQSEMLWPPSCCRVKPLAIATPLVAMMKDCLNVVDIAPRGIVPIILRFIAIVAARLLVSQAVLHIMQGDIAVALVLAIGPIATGLLNAVALSN